MLDYDELRRSSAMAEEREEALETKRSGGLKSLTAVQRFILALMLFLNIAVLGCLCLLVTNRITLPF